MDLMMEKLAQLDKRANEINELMMDVNIVSDQKRFANLGKEQASLSKILTPYHRLLAVLKNIDEANSVIESGDVELLDIAKEELAEFSQERDLLVEKLQLLLVPKDADDDKNAIVEIRGAAGGDEGNIFAGDLFRMYTKYCESMGFKTNVLEASESEAGGYSQIIFEVTGKDEPYGHLKFESGSHRVQRVPKTETQGRVHTSTATVLVLPEVEETDFELNPDDLVYDIHHATGAGGQHVNKTSSAVRITHTPTGISVNCQEGRSQHENRATALQLIRSRVYEHMEQERLAKEGAIRKSKIGSGDRSEKIRTYNYPQNRVSDHRIGLTLNQLDRIMEGKLADVIDALIEFDQKERLANSEN